MDKIDVAIIGGGVVGLAVAASIAEKDKDIFIFEKHFSFGQETSSRNSEVIHSGIYYPKDSFKRKTCVEGNELLYDICRQGKIPHRKIGKMIIARDNSDLEGLEKLFRQGMENGLQGLKMLDKKEIAELEPNIRACRAIYLPMTGIIDSHSLMEYFLLKAKSNGADIVYDSEIKSIEKVPDGYKVTIMSNTNEEMAFLSRIVINCAGLEADVISEMIGIKNKDYKLSYCKGDYFRVGNRKNLMVKRLIYPVANADDTFLGIHVTPDLTGGVRLGPDAEYVNNRNMDYAINPDKSNLFYADTKTFLPFLEKDDLSVDTSGIRPKLQKKGEGFRDFVIKHEASLGFEGFVNLIGIESPGLTASPAIAKTVKNIISKLI
ncbi:MAG: NAD(P)/FAD-dependent oxidoreductase [Candidatus Omnitrophota bacterium]